MTPLQRENRTGQIRENKEIIIIYGFYWSNIFIYLAFFSCHLIHQIPMGNQPKRPPYN